MRITVVLLFAGLSWVSLGAGSVFAESQDHNLITFHDTFYQSDESDDDDDGEENGSCGSACYPPPG